MTKATWEALDKIIERLGNDVQFYPPELTFYDFKFDADYGK